MFNSQIKSIYLAGIAGSGIYPLAWFLKSLGFIIHGSDRFFDQNNQQNLKNKLIKYGFIIHSENGEGIDRCDLLIRSTAVENSTATVQKAIKQGLPILERTQVYAMISALTTSICIAGTSGKSTTGLILFHLLRFAHKHPAALIGAKLQSSDFYLNLYKNSLILSKKLITVIEADESEGLLNLYHPNYSVITNISEDHLDLNLLYNSFQSFANNSKVCLIPSELNITAPSLKIYKPKNYQYQGIKIENGKIYTSFEYEGLCFKIPLMGRHNIENTITAISTAKLLDIPYETINSALTSFPGVHRRLELVGKFKQSFIFDDFAHNPAKIKASLGSLTESFDSLLIIFRPHGFSPLKKYGNLIAQSFSRNLRKQDFLWILPVFYSGGTTADQNYNQDYLADLISRDNSDLRITTGEFRFNHLNCNNYEAVVTMGARDPSLPLLARRIAQIDGRS
ncbi:MAG: Mur ligase family protein [bacterium]